MLALPVADTAALGAAAVISGVIPGARGILLGAFYAAVVLVVLAAGRQHRLRICLRVSDQVGRIMVAIAVPALALLAWLPATRVLGLALWSGGLVVACRAHTALTAGMPCTPAAAASCWLESTSIFASTHAPAPSAASRSKGPWSRGRSAPLGQKSMTTGTVIDRSRMSTWKDASVTSMTVTGAPPFAGAVEAADGGEGAGCGRRASESSETAPANRGE